MNPLKIFRDWQFKNMMKKCDFAAAARDLGQVLAGKVIPAELAGRAKEFCKNPCYDSAMRLIDYDPNLAGFFGAYYRP